MALVGNGNSRAGAVALTAPAVTPSGPFEWANAERLSGWLWLPLGVLLVAPWALFPMPLPERGVPIFWLCAGGGLVLFARVARVSWPLAVLLGWALARAVMNDIIVDPASLQAGAVVLDASRGRALQILVLLAMVSMLYVAARVMTSEAAQWAVYAFVAGAIYEGVFGYLNLWGIYPWMKIFVLDQIGRPMGFLTHPNYWGSYEAMALPLVWAVLGALPALAIFAMIIVSWSAGPAISASAGIALLLWPRLGRRMKYVAVVGLTTAVSVVMTVHEWRLSGRREVWQAIWPELSRFPIIGQGIGGWRVWADAYNAKTQSVFATLQAHSEPYQLWFELGLIGVGLAALWAWQAWLAARRTWTLARAGNAAPWWAPGWISTDRALVAVLLVGAVNALGSPTFHLPAQAGLMLFVLGRLQARAAEAGPTVPVAPAHTFTHATRAARRRAAQERETYAETRHG